MHLHSVPSSAKILRRIFGFVLVLLVFASPAFAGGSQSRDRDSGVVKVPIMLRDGGNDANTQMWRELIEIYNRTFAGTYELEVEWVPGMAAELREKLKLQNSAGQLPAVVTDLAQEPAFAELLIENDRLMDLSPYFAADNEWQQLVFPESVEFNTRSDGRMYTAPVAGTQYVGVFYNKELFAQAGISRFPETWDELWNASEALMAQGITPFSLHTQETGWVTNLWLTTYLARTEAGRAIMNTKYPTNEFNSAEFLDAVAMLERLYSFSTSDAIGGNYASAANLFSAGQTAMIANGPWMIPSLSDPQYSPVGFENVVGYATFPGSMMISSQGTEYGLAVSMDHPLAVREGAVEWIKLVSGREEGIRLGIKYEGKLTNLVTLTEDQRSGMGPVDLYYLDAVASTTQTIPWFQAQWDPITQNETVVRNLPRFLLGEITAAEYAASMAESARMFLASQ